MKLLEYYSSCFLECASKQSECLGDDQASLILCLDSSLTASGAPYIDAVLVSTSRKACNSNCVFHYTIQYDEDLLINPNTFLTQDQITTVLCRNCLTQYIDYKIETVTGIQAAECPSDYFVGAP